MPARYPPRERAIPQTHAYHPKVWPDESALIAGALANDPAAVRTIVQRNNRRLYRIARGVVRNDNEAEDIVQAAYGRAFTHLSSFNANSSIGTWLARIVLNEALGRVRRQRETVDLGSVEDRLHAQIVPPVMIADPERTVAQREVQALLERAIDDLPEPFRLALVARAIEGMSVEETAELLSIRPDTVKTRVHRARALLKARLERDLGPALTETFPFAGARCERITSKVVADLQLRPPPTDTNLQLTGEPDTVHENPYNPPALD
jgi:RNA polymerase sigma-70 factor (ECF subfamily)